MSELKLIRDYKDNDKYRRSLNRLAGQIFGISFEEWHQRGFWDEHYIPYSYVDGDEVVANVGANTMDLILNGEKRKAIQIGTVMTHPDYRNRGLSADLINLVLKEYETQYDLFYLFANRSVLNFYPQFGFRPVAETRFTLDVKGDKTENNGLKKLDINSPGVLEHIYEKASLRRPVSNIFGVANAQNLMMFYCLNVFNDCIYHLEVEDILIICQKENQILHIYDLISAVEIDFPKLLNKIVSDGITQVVFYFTPDMLHIEANQSPLVPDDVLFVKTTSFDMTTAFQRPKTSQA